MTHDQVLFLLGLWAGLIVLVVFADRRWGRSKPKWAKRTSFPSDENVAHLRQITTEDVDANRIIDFAAQVDFSGVVIIGHDTEGREYFASSYADGGDVVWHLERAKFKLMVISDKIAEEAPFE